MPHYSVLQMIGIVALGAVVLAGVGWLDWRARVKPVLEREKDREDKEMGTGAYRHPPLNLDGVDSPTSKADEL
jgi:hypothetical protein